MSRKRGSPPTQRTPLTLACALEDDGSPYFPRISRLPPEANFTMVWKWATSALPLGPLPHHSRYYPDQQQLNHSGVTSQRREHSSLPPIQFCRRSRPRSSTPPFLSAWGAAGHQSGKQRDRSALSLSSFTTPDKLPNLSRFHLLYCNKSFMWFLKCMKYV